MICCLLLLERFFFHEGLHLSCLIQYVYQGQGELDITSKYRFLTTYPSLYGVSTGDDAWSKETVKIKTSGIQSHLARRSCDLKKTLFSTLIGSS